MSKMSLKTVTKSISYFSWGYTQNSASETPMILLNLFGWICFFPCFTQFWVDFERFFGCIFFEAAFQMRQYHYWIQHQIVHMIYLWDWLICMNDYKFFPVLAHFRLFWFFYSYSSISTNIQVFLMQCFLLNPMVLTVK